MQSKTTFKRIGGFLQKSLMILGLFCFFVGKINAQIYTNGNLSTGPTASSGEAAPAGSNWSEVQTGNANAGFSANITNGFSLADDFTIPGGTWGLTKFTCFAYSTGYAGAASPFTDMRVQIFDTDPSAGGVTPIYGDLTTNALTASSAASLYRIFNATAATNRIIWKLEANINISLTAGHYWVEWQTGTTLASNFSPASTVVGTTTQAGNNALQHTLAADTWAPVLDGPTATDPQDMPFIIDYTTSACSGTPAPGATLTTQTSACPGIPFTLSATNGTGGSGVTYQWQSSSTGGAGSFTDIGGATNSTYTTTITATTYYQVVVSCNGTPGTSTPVQVSLTPPNGCYCIPDPTDCTDGDIITNVTLGALNNTTDCGTNGYTDNTIDPTITIPDLVQGVANPIAVTAGGGIYTEIVGAWIDYDHSGSFDPSEFTLIGQTTGGTLNANIIVPATAPLGPARMRLRVRFNTPLTGGMACDPYTFGETEDYTVNIIPCIQGVFNTEPTNMSTTCGSGVTFTTATTGTFLSYQWQQQAGTGAPWTNLTNGINITGATTNTLHIVAVTSDWNGYNYRLLIGGGCTATDFSDIVSLTVTDQVINVSPTSYSTCSPIPAGSPVQLSITTEPPGVTYTTVSYSSGTLNTTIPDDDPTGIINAINVPALPAGATVTAASVTLNINHTWIGDLVIALKAPNDNILNLDYGLTSTGGSGVTTGFTNTVFSSAAPASATLVSGSDPWTGTFAPDAPAAPGTIPTAPLSLSPTNANVFTFADLYSVPSGDWTIGINDIAPPDEGTLVDWTLTLTYTTAAAGPYTGVWSPATGLFTDAAGTIPYTAGSQASTVYAAPGSSTVYTVTVTDPICPPAPVEVPVRILTADPVVTITATPATNIYPGIRSLLTANVNPELSATGTYQWLINGTEIPGANAKTYEVTFANTGLGDYSVDVIDSAICSGRVSSDIITISDSARNQLFIWPNPSTGQFQVRFFDGVNDIISGNPYLMIFDAKGSRVITQKYSVTAPYGRMDVDLSNQPKGTYIVSLYTADGKLLQSGRVIIR
ncbi:MAG: GEVED domain-containing protein [Ferruginibacter sp.]